MLKFLVSAQNKIDIARDRFLENESGNAAEYGLIIGLIAVVIIIGLTALGVALRQQFLNVAGQV